MTHYIIRKLKYYNLIIFVIKHFKNIRVMKHRDQVWINVFMQNTGHSPATWFVIDNAFNTVQTQSSNLSRQINTLRPRQNGRLFLDDIFKWIFLNENVWISIKISLKFVPKGPINNIPALVQIMAWRRPGDKPLSEPMMVRLPTHICVTRPQWINSFGHADTL